MGPIAMGRKPVFETAMTAAERQRRRRERLKQGLNFLALGRAWDECTRAERAWFLREL